MTLNRSFPSLANPQRLGAGPAIYAQALSSVSFMYTWIRRSTINRHVLKAHALETVNDLRAMVQNI